MQWIQMRKKGRKIPPSAEFILFSNLNEKEQTWFAEQQQKEKENKIIEAYWITQQKKKIEKKGLLNSKHIRHNHNETDTNRSDQLLNLIINVEAKNGKIEK